MHTLQPSRPKNSEHVIIEGKKASDDETVELARFFKNKNKIFCFKKYTLA